VSLSACVRPKSASLASARNSRATSEFPQKGEYKIMMKGFVCETAGREACYVRVGLLFLGVQRATLSDAQTRSLLDGIAANVDRMGPGKGLLMFAPDAAPTSEQRRMIVEEYGERTGIKNFRRVALLTNSAIGRGVLTALSWLTSGTRTRTRAWKPKEWHAALSWLREDVDFDVNAAVTAFNDVLRYCSYEPAAAVQ